MKKWILWLAALLLVVPTLANAQSFKFAYLKVDGSNLIVIPLDGDEMRDKGDQDAKEILGLFEQCMANNGFTGVTFIAWANSRGGMSFHGPKSWHPYMKTKNMAWVYKNSKKRVDCD